MLEISPKELTSVLQQPFDGERPDRVKAEEAVKTLIRRMGDDHNREGLRDTPSRVLRAYEEWFASATLDDRRGDRADLGKRWSDHFWPPTVK